MFNIKKISSKSTSYLGYVAIASIVLTTLSTPVKAEQNHNNSDYGLPTHRRDGGSRGVCSPSGVHRNLVALIPENTVGINASSSPKIFFYIPKVSQQETLEFVLRNEQDELMYETFLTTEGEGIMSVEVPANLQANLLEPEQNYRWYLSMICDSKWRSKDIVLEGWMRQSTIDLATQQELNAANPVEQAELFYQQGFWYDALSVLAENYQSPTEKSQVEAKWSELLESVGLEDIAAKPIIESEIIEIQP